MGITRVRHKADGDLVISRQQSTIGARPVLSDKDIAPTLLCQ
jgi:hypothetical protein